MKNKFVKFCMSVLTILLLMTPITVFALVYPGDSFTVTLTCGYVEGTVSYDASNATITGGQGDYFCERNETVTLTAKATSVGTATISMLAVDALGNVNDPSTMYQMNVGQIISSKSVTISNRNSGGSSNSSGSSSSGGSTYVPVQDTRSSNADLSSLSLAEGELSPAFSKETTSYTVNLAADIKKVTIEATAEDSKATISGTGEKEVSAGENTLSVIVTAENGSTKTYTITATVDEKPLVYLTYNKKELGVVRNLKGLLVPSGFSTSSITVDGNKINAWTNETMNKTIIYLIDEETNEKNFYVYDAEEEKITTMIRPLTIKGKLLYEVELDEKLQNKEGFVYGDVVVDEMSLKGWKFEDESLANYTLIYVMDTNGEMKYYLYEENENTLQLYTGNAPISQKAYETLVKDLKQANTLKVVFMVLTGILSIISAGGIWYYLNHRKR